MKIKVSVYEKRCPFCKKLIRTLQQEEFASAMQAHIDHCKIAQTLIGWEKQGIRKEMIAYLRKGELEKELRKLVKEYTLIEIKDALETIKIEGEESDDSCLLLPEVPDVF